LRRFDDKLVVFSIPSYFTQVEKLAVVNSGVICGLGNVQMVSENVAMGLDYRCCKKFEAINGKNIMFVDFGYSKLSVGVIGFMEGRIDVVYERCERNVGCRNIDKCVY
jgi:molecular chaperone DnaK (HSP70)